MQGDLFDDEVKIKKLQAQVDKDDAAVASLRGKLNRAILEISSLNRQLSKVKTFKDEYAKWTTTQNAYIANMNKLFVRYQIKNADGTMPPWYSKGDPIDHAFSPIPRDYAQTTSAEIEQWWTAETTAGAPDNYLPFVPDEEQIKHHVYMSYRYPRWLGYDPNGSTVGIARNLSEGTRPYAWGAKAQGAWRAFAVRSTFIWKLLTEKWYDVPPRFPSSCLRDTPAVGICRAISLPPHCTVPSSSSEIQKDQVGPEDRLQGQSCSGRSPTGEEVKEFAT